MQLDLKILITETMKRYEKNECIIECLKELKECIEKLEGEKIK